METIRREAKALVLVFVILVVFTLVLNAKVDAFKAEINAVVRQQCLSGASTGAVTRYNDQLQAQISDAQAIGDNARAKRLTADLIPVVKQDCSKPLLP